MTRCTQAASGSAVVDARVTPEVRSGAVFVPYFVRQVQLQLRGTAENGVQLLPVRIEKSGRPVTGDASRTFTTIQDQFDYAPQLPPDTFVPPWVMGS